jgi:hypothetical protein
MVIVKYLARGILILIGSLLVIPMLIITVIAAALCELAGYDSGKYIIRSDKKKGDSK